MIIYPPYIADTIPAFTTDKIIIPFVMNPAADISQVKSFRIKIMDYIESKLLATITDNTDENNLNYDLETKSGTITFSPNIDLKQGQYYKFQLSFSHDNTFDFFSTASLGRCIGEAPTLKIIGKQNEELSTDNINIGSDSFSCYYITTLLSEPLYSYRFYVYNKDSKEIIQDSGWLLHNVDNDSYEDNKRNSRHDFNLKYELENYVYYSIVYQIKTVNDYMSEIECSIMKQGYLPIIFNGQIKANQTIEAIENGYVQIDIEGEPIRGKFELQRTSNDKEWNILTTFEMTELSDMSIFSWKDWSVEQGVVYTYAIRQTANGQYSERLKSSPIKIKFEHMFLSDGERQLKIAFNPKVSSIKDTILENKMDTIGNQYPFFFRNNIVRYKELPISGLISYLSDDNELFLTNKELGLVEDPDSLIEYNNNENVEIRTTNLYNYNFSAERKFKLAVMDWLNNGKPKLFRSPAEGNYIVRVMNTSLSPNEQIGRMLHTFSSTAYEIMDYNIVNLQEYNLFNLNNVKISIPEPEPIIITYMFDDLFSNNLNECNLVEYINQDSNTKKIKEGTITNIIWHAARPDINDYIKINNNKYYNNVTGIFQTPSGIQYESIFIKKPTNSENYGSSITLTYIPDLSDDYGEDSFEFITSSSKDILFTVSAGYYLRENPSGESNVDNCILYIQSGDSKNYINIYKTYTMTVRKDPNYVLKDNEKTDAYILKFFNKDNNSLISEIDCNDGQIRYFNDINANLLYEKGAGLTMDIYACVGSQEDFNSSILSSFILNSSVLGG